MSIETEARRPAFFGAVNAVCAAQCRTFGAQSFLLRPTTASRPWLLNDGPSDLARTLLPFAG